MAAGPTPREMLARLVAFPTVSSRSNLDLIDFVEGYLAGLGVASLRVPDATGEKASLLALVGPAVAGRRRALGPHRRGAARRPGLDQRPLRADRARRPALRPRHLRHEGLLRLALALVPEMLAAGLKRPIILALSRDEEIGCLGAPDLIAAMLDALPAPRGGDRRRALGDARGHRPQGQLGLPRRGARPRGAFEPDPHRRLGGDGGGAARRLDGRRHGRERPRRRGPATSIRPTPRCTSA